MGTIVRIEDRRQRRTLPDEEELGRPRANVVLDADPFGSEPFPPDPPSGARLSGEPTTPDRLDVGRDDDPFDWSLPVCDRPRFTPGAVIASRYRIEERLATGGMGTVWIAADESPERRARRVALKVIGRAYERDEIMRERFRREASIASTLVGPQFVPVLDWGSHDGAAFMVMELLDGEDLHDRLERVGRLSPHEALDIVRALSEALAVAHAAGVVHRDLKPRNVFLTSEGVVKILDFGVAKIAASTKLTREGVLVGSPHYMSPEQAAGASDVDHRADLWSLGATIYRCLTGRRPFEGDAATLVEAILTSEPPAASSVAPHLARAFDAFFERALAKRAEDRFQDAVELARAYEAVLEGIPDSRAGSASADRAIAFGPSASGAADVGRFADWEDQESDVASPPSSTRETTNGATAATRALEDASWEEEPIELTTSGLARHGDVALAWFVALAPFLAFVVALAVRS